MGMKEKKLKEILCNRGIIMLKSETIDGVIKKILYGIKKDEIFKVYKQLVGIYEGYAYRGRCDIITEKYII